MWRFFRIIVLTIGLCFLSGFSKNPSIDAPKVTEIKIIGVDFEIMEPAISCDGKTLYFNNTNKKPDETDIFYANKISDNVFKLMGRVPYINQKGLDGVPSIDCNGNLYFISTRTYFENFETMYRINDKHQREIISGLSKKNKGDLIFDFEVSRNGEYIIGADGVFNFLPMPLASDLFIAQKNGQGFKRLSNSSDIMKNVNSNELEYAPSISMDMLMLCFTRAHISLFKNNFKLMCAKRPNINEAFGTPETILSSNEWLEAPSITNDGKEIYFHKQSGKFDKIFKVMVR